MTLKKKKKQGYFLSSVIMAGVRDVPYSSQRRTPPFSKCIFNSGSPVSLLCFLSFLIYIRKETLGDKNQQTSLLPVSLPEVCPHCLPPDIWFKSFQFMIFYILHLCVAQKQCFALSAYNFI